MRTAIYSDKKDFYIWKDIFAQTSTSTNDSQSFPVFSKDFLETAAILVLCAVLLVAVSILTIKIVELFILLVKQSFFLSLIDKTQAAGLNFSGLNELSFIRQLFL